MHVGLVIVVLVLGVLTTSSQSCCNKECCCPGCRGDCQRAAPWNFTGPCNCMGRICGSVSVELPIPVRYPTGPGPVIPPIPGPIIPPAPGPVIPPAPQPVPAYPTIAPYPSPSPPAYPTAAPPVVPYPIGTGAYALPYPVVPAQPEGGSYPTAVCTCETVPYCLEPLPACNGTTTEAPGPLDFLKSKWALALFIACVVMAVLLGILICGCLIFAVMTLVSFCVGRKTAGRRRRDDVDPEGPSTVSERVGSRAVYAYRPSKTVTSLEFSANDRTERSGRLGCGRP